MNQASDLTSSASLFIIAQIVYRTIVTIVCTDKAKNLNRNIYSWGLFAFTLPILSLIFIFLTTPKVAWRYAVSRVN